jgi:uncharacterized protein (TIGR02677 family)
MQVFKSVKEASYLTAEKAWSYRAILRYFFMQHERMREFIFPEEVYEHVRSAPGFENYLEEQLHQDLEQLVRWNNLIARQETGKARTIEEFKKKRFRYQCTPYTVEFERMLQNMEMSGDAFGGSLEKKEFERLYQALHEVESAVKTQRFPEQADCAQLWNDVFTYFRSITKNTSDYIAHINSEEAQERMQTEAFLVFKDQFTTYLRDFIIELQQTALKIQQLLHEIAEEQLQPFLEQVIAHQQKIPRFQDLTDDQTVHLGAEKDKWESLVIWFLGNIHGESELEMLEIRTNEQIRRITRVVQRLGERHNSFRSRKKDYLHVAKWFDSLENMDEAHELSAIVFGVPHTKHLYSDHVPTDNIYTEVWEEAPMTHLTKPRIRNYREKTRAGAIISQNEKKVATKRAYLQQKQQEQSTVASYMENNEIDLEHLPVIEPYVRKMFLGWIGKAMMRKDRTIQTEHGRTVVVHIYEKEHILLKAQDGMLTMPKVIFQYKDGVEM